MAEFHSHPFVGSDFTIPEDEFVIFGLVYAHPDKADALEAVYVQTTKIAETEPGCVYYCISRDPDDRTAFHFFERYRGKAAFLEHISHPVQQKLQEDQLIKGVKAKFLKAIEPREGGS